MSPETALYNAIAAAVTGAEEDDVLFQAQVCQTLYDEITAAFGVRVGNSDFDLSPVAGGAVDEFDLLTAVQVFARLAGDSSAQMTAAREKARDLGLAVAQLLFDDPTIGGAVHDCRILGGKRGWGNVAGNRFAAEDLHLIVNETGNL